MEASTGKITWGYIWRLIVWDLLTGFVLTFIFGLILATTSGISYLNSLESIIPYYKKYLIGTLIIGLASIIIACKFATSGIQKKFVVNEYNVKKIFRNIVIVLIVLTVIYIIYNLINISNTQQTIDSIDSLNSSLINTQLLKDFAKFGTIFSVIVVILNSIVMLLMIPLEKKLLNIVEIKNKGVTLIKIIIGLIILLVILVGIIIAIKVSSKNENNEKTNNNFTAQKNNQLIDNDVNSNKKEDTKTKIEKTIYTNEEVLKKLGITENTGTYTGTWTAIGIENNKIKLISTENVMEELILGYGDTGKASSKSLEETTFGESEEQLERAVWSYNNVKKTLNTAARRETGIKTARSVTIEDIEELLKIEDINKPDDYGKSYKYYYPEDENNIYSQYKEGNNWSEGQNTNNEKFRSYDRWVTKEEPIELTYNWYMYKIKDEEIEKYPFLKTRDFWTASTNVQCFSNEASFMVFIVNDTYVANCVLFSSDGHSRNQCEGVRAIVYIPTT